MSFGLSSQCVMSYSWHRARGCAPPPQVASLLCEQLFDATGDQYRDIHQHARQGDAAAGDEVFRLPMRIELGLVAAQPLEVVEMLAVAEDEIADATPGRRERVAIETRERRHAEIEPAVALCAAPAHELEEKKVHRPSGRLGREPHEIDGELGTRVGRPEVGESGRHTRRA